MKEEKPRLVLNKRTLAHLNNLEMTHVRGGDGEEGTPTRTGCGDMPENDPKSILVELTRKMISRLVTACAG